VASTLAGAWRTSPAQIELSAAQLAQLLPLLLEDGTAGLVWQRLSPTGTATSWVVRPARDAYRAGLLEAARWEKHIRRIVRLLRSRGADPILIKGWASARNYAEPGLRPFGDIDLCVRHDQLMAAQTALSGSDHPILVDLHAGIPDLPDRDWDEVYTRSRMVLLDDVEVRVLGPEDHLRLVCFHFVRHSGCRPIWLCDVAAAIESHPTDFDWDYFLAGNPSLNDWVRCVVGLAGRLLFADLAQTAQAWAERVPRWLESTVQWRWGAGLRQRSVGYYLRDPVEAFQGLRYHGFNAIRGVFQLGLSPFTRWPVPLVQVAGAAVVATLRKRARWQTSRAQEAESVPMHRPLALRALRRYSNHTDA
jgi:hypothetical protein